MSHYLLCTFDSRLDTNATWCMKEMPTALPEEVSIQTSCSVHRPNADDHRPLKLIWPREDDCRHVREYLKEILERRLDR